jgi:hypothetical protein
MVFNPSMNRTICALEMGVSTGDTCRILAEKITVVAELPATTEIGAPFAYVTVNPSAAGIDKTGERHVKAVEDSTDTLD